MKFWIFHRAIGLNTVLGLLNLCLLPAIAVTPALGAERIRLSYGLLSRTIPIESLETYANTGEVDAALERYTRNISPEQLSQFRQLLQSPIPLTAVELSQFLYTPIGQRLLARLAAIIKTNSSQAGLYGIRAALILAAQDPQGLTLLNVFRQFPLTELEIDLARAQEIGQGVNDFVNQTNAAVDQITQQAALEAARSPRPDQPPTELEEPGPFRWERRTLTLTDPSRESPTGGTTEQRTFPVDLYLPLSPTPRPVIVISHGLGSERTSFAYLAEHLASYGYGVAVPEHPGSSAEQLQALLEGTAAQVTSPNEFVDRPLDITLLLDELSRLSGSNGSLQGRLDLQQVGVVGQSFGGYTALALAGAPLHLEYLATECLGLENSLNLSLFLQCVALGLPQSQYDLSDPRITAAIAINPVSSSIFGQESLAQINRPVMVIAGSNDTIAPALAEQIQPFTWLTTPEKYLVLIEQGTHFSVISPSSEGAVPIPPEVVGPRPALARAYMQVLSVAFFQSYLEPQQNNNLVLNAAYVNLLDQPPLALSLVRSLPSLPP